MGKSMKPGGGGRFVKLEAKFERQGLKSPGGLAAKLGRKRYGIKQMTTWATAGRTMK